MIQDLIYVTTYLFLLSYFFSDSVNTLRQNKVQSPYHAQPGNLDLPLHPHPIVEPGLQPPQVEPIPTEADSVPKVSAIRKEVRRVFCDKEDDAWAARVRGYTMQGNLFALLQAKSEGITWKSYMWNLPCGVLKFALNASIDTLPTFTNLKSWGKRASVNCHLCGNTVKQTLFHVLVHCNHTMDQGRMTWRHDSILKHIAGCLKSALKSLHPVEDCRPRVAGQSRLRSWSRHRNQTWSFLTGQLA
jgi:hypothetical protein